MLQGRKLLSLCTWPWRGPPTEWTSWRNAPGRVTAKLWPSRAQSGDPGQRSRWDVRA